MCERPFVHCCSAGSAACMQEATEIPPPAWGAPDGRGAPALRAEAWAGEPFLRAGEDPARVLAPGTSRRRALDDALAEIDAGRREPSPQWKVRYGLMLGLERVLAEQPPRLASGTELRRHQVDALAGMLTELISSHEKQGDGDNGNGAVAEEPLVEEEDDDDDAVGVASGAAAVDEAEEHEWTGPDPGAIRRYRFRHPTASGKTIAAAGFVEAARTLGVLILTHRRLLVSQFQRDLTAEGYGDRFSPPVERGKEPLRGGNPLPIVGGDFDQEILAKTLDHQALNQAAASLYRDRFDNTPGIVYAAGVDHAYHLAQEFRAAGLKAEAVSGRTPPVKLAETLAAYERGEINVLINAMLLAEGWNSPRATVVMHLAPTASRRVYQQRIGRIMRLHPRKEAGIVVDFVHKSATHNDRVVSLHSLLDADFYREGARVTPAPRRRHMRRAKRYLTPAPWLVPVTPDVRRRLGVIQREWQRIDPKYLDEDEQRYWATIAGRNMRFEDRTELVRKFTERGASKGALETFLSVCAAENPNRRLRMIAIHEGVSSRV